ncbi:MAG TPA: hypothetical protein EYQ25_14015 [Planctomycetes bacterium]|nr:hypothetical protein [Planctomycetota bacterium]HIL36497.1 hypothetical protein [Planctomycetota bacterium]
MEQPARIYLVGAHSTGKTTLARWIRDNYGIPMISEVARSVLAEMEAQVDSLRADVDLVNRYQAEVFLRQARSEAEAEQRGAFVSDRAFCNLAYAAQHGTLLAEVARDPRLAAYMQGVKQGLVFFVRPHQALLASDGVRERLDWEEVLRIDGMVKFMLEFFGVPYVPVASLAMQERQRCLERVLSLAGLEKATPDTRYLSGLTREAAQSLEQSGPESSHVISKRVPESALR